MESAGARLKKIRQEKGLSLEEVQKKTKIYLNILKAIEGDSLTDLSPIYLKGFLKIYCKFLGVDPKDYIPDYKETQSQPLNVIVTKDVKTATGRLDFLKSTGKKNKRIFIFILIIIALSLVLYNLGKVVSSRHKLQLTRARPVYFIPKKAKHAADNTVAKKETTSGIKLGIRAHENCWVDLRADGRLIFRRVLEKGRFETWQAKDRIELSLGNAGAVELEVNGQRFLNLGRKRQAIKGIVITKEGLNIGR
jgi:cytoskeletal protein RodZ